MCPRAHRSVPRATALGTAILDPSPHACPSTGRAGHEPGDDHLPSDALQHLVDRQRSIDVQIHARFRAIARAPRARDLEHVGEEIAEGRGLRAFRARRKVEPLKLHRRRLRRRRPRPVEVVLPPLRGVAECVVRFDHLAKKRLAWSVAGIDVGVKSACEPTIRPFDLRERRASLEAEDNVEIHAISRRSPHAAHYFFSSSTTSASITSPPSPLPEVSEAGGGWAVPVPRPACASL